ncbi:F-box protein [Phanerochaete sordida]|uniref:F-box protein n=1 Tax=Phanerochaete sordida TaxID=48140 RepID=A0A9P3LD81_9APHY|nr:F-box protein [Phanerochaete sordida]
METTISNLLHLSDADAAVAEARDEVRRAQDRLRSLISYRNTLLPIEALPDEILLEVFNILVHSSFTPSYQWIPVTHVCRRWRTAALGCPVLWTRIHCVFPKSQLLHRLDAFLERSQPCPIDVDLPFNTSWYYEPGFKQVLEQRHRWRNVATLEISPDFMFELQELQVRKLELPLVETLDVHFGNFFAFQNLNEITNPSLPALKRLTSDFIRWPVFKTWMVPTLVHLEVSGHSHLHTATLADWIAALRPLSSLQTLVLRNTFDHISLDEDIAGASPSPILIHLPFLRTLRIVARSQNGLGAGVSLSTHIASPWSTEVKIECQRPLELEVHGCEAPFTTMAVKTGVSISNRPAEDDSAIWVWFSWVDRGLHMKVIDMGPTPERTLLDMQFPAQHDAENRPALEDFVAHVVRGCPSLCNASMLLLVNLGMGRAMWDALKPSPVPQVLIGRKVFPTFLDALEADPGAFMPELDFLTVCTLPRRSRLPIPRPEQKVGQAQRPLLQRLADAFDERRSFGLGPTSVSFGHGKVDNAAPQRDSSHAVQTDNLLHDEEDENQDLSLPALFGTC